MAPLKLLILKIDRMERNKKFNLDVQGKGQFCSYIFGRSPPVQRYKIISQNMTNNFLAACIIFFHMIIRSQKITSMSSIHLCISMK